ncbi:MAG TPA: sulfite exporter TauE/SafE family protein [Gemmatimonadales bacterium]|jgi:uncharacterized membrane protein YfcA
MTTTDDTAPAPTSPLRWTALIALGFVTDFLDTLGVGSFATTSTALKLGHVTTDENIPGTLNVGHAIPTVVEALIYIVIIPLWLSHAENSFRVEPLTLITMVAAGALGAWLGAGRVSRWPRRTIQLALSVALLLTAGFITMRLLYSFPDEGTFGLTGPKLIIGILANALFGALCTLGIGNYAPCMALVALLGMNPTVAFPIMMGSAALFLPIGAIRFLKARRYNRNVVIGLTLGGVPGVLVAAFIVKSLPLTAVKWLVVGVLTYTSALMWMSAKQSAAAAAKVPAAA